MEAKCSANHIRISARKMRLVANEVRGFDFTEAVDTLKNMQQNSAVVVLKAVLSAAANAKVLSADIDESSLFVSKIFVDEGVTWKRFSPRARGRADRVFRRTSRLTVVLSDE